MSRGKSVLWISLFFWSVLITVVLYGKALQLPLFFDDLDFIPYVERTSFLEIWQSTGGFPYYRPFTATIWRLLYLLLNDQRNVFAYHSLNLVLHAVNGTAVGILAHQLWSQPNSDSTGRPFTSAPLRAFLSATLFLFYPFSYQAVPWVVSLFHILATTLVVLSVLSYWLFRQTGKVVWMVMGLLSALLAAFSQENGIMVGPLVIALEATRHGTNIRQIFAGVKKASLWLLPLLIWLPIWNLATQSGGRRPVIRGVETLIQNTTYFAQGVAYPITWIGQELRLVWAWNDLYTALSFSLLGLLLLLLIFVLYSKEYSDTSARITHLISFAYPLIWFLLAMLPAILLLGFGYVISGMRLLMLSSVGAAWLWANAIVCLISMAASAFGIHRGRGAFLGLAAVSLTMLILIQNYSFIRNRNQLYDLLDSAVDQAVDLTIEANSQGKTAVFINFPNWAAPAKVSFPFGHEGVMFKPDYIPDDKIISEQIKRPLKMRFMYYSDIKPQMPYLYSVLGKGENWPDLVHESEPAAIYATKFFTDHVVIEPVGYTGLTVPAPKTQPLALFQLPNDGQSNDPIILHNAEITAQNDDFRLDFVWQIGRPPPHEVTVFVHVLNEHGELISQWDGAPWSRTYPMGEWEEGAVIQDTRILSLNRSDAKSVHVGLYNYMTGERLIVTTDDGVPLPNNSVSLPIP